jgi:hypothetical protein
LQVDWPALVASLYSILAFAAEREFSGKKWQTAAKTESSQNRYKLRADQQLSTIVKNSRNRVPDLKGMKLFYTGPQVNAELLLVMLEKHGIQARQQWADPAAPDDGDLNRPTQILVEESDYERAYALFYTEREDEL